MLFRSLPPGLSPEARRAIERRVAPEKDVDGFLPQSQGHLLLGEPGFVPCTPAGCMRLLAEAEISPRGRHAVVIGRSNIVGKPMALLLLAADATVTIAHSRTPDLPAVVRGADIVVAAVGVPGILRPEHFRAGSVVIGAGVRYEGRKVLPDVDESCADVAGWITPRVGGVGPTTIAMLFRNTVEIAERRLGIT